MTLFQKKLAEYLREQYTMHLDLVASGVSDPNKYWEHVGYLKSLASVEDYCVELADKIRKEEFSDDDYFPREI